MSQMMNALAFDRKKHPWDQSQGLEKIQVPVPTLDETKRSSDGLMVLVKVHYAGFCGSDKSIWHRRAFKDLIHHSLDEEGRDVRITGHELIGEIVAMGSLVGERYGLSVGQMVSAESHIICGTCYQCHTGQAHVCVNERILGISCDGCFAEYVKLPSRILWPTSVDRIDPRVAAIQEPFGNAVHLCTKTDLRGKTVVILGCGTIGLFSILIARAMGATHIIGVEPNARHREMALEMDCDQVLDPGDFEAPSNGFGASEDLVKAVKSLCHHGGADVVFEVAGMNSSVNNALSMVRRGGTVLLFGLQGGTFQIPHFEKIIMNGILIDSVIGRQVFQTWHHTRALLEDSTNKIQDRIWRIILNSGDGTVHALRDFEPEAFEQAFHRHPKVVLAVK
jgi:threonine 3-dehydrogenase